MTRGGPHAAGRGAHPDPRLARAARFALLPLLALLALALAACAHEPYCITCGDGGIDATRPDARDGSAEVSRADAGPSCTPSDAAEACNGADDNCDGVVDEGFDLVRDPRNCGRCGAICEAENAEVECRMGACVMTGCAAGFADLDPMRPGCEYRCPVFPTQGEACNGVDDDCDGTVDEPDGLAPPPAMLCRVTPGTPCATARPVCATRGGRTTWFCDYAAAVEFDPNIPNGIALEETRCDGQDGDCDGVPDDAFPTLGRACDNGALGACRDVGVVRCDPMNTARTRCDLSVAPDPVPGAPSAEVCNNVDDNCDGVVDNSSPTDPARVRDDMVHVVRGGLDFWVYRYEASRPDATATAGGTVTARSCSRAGVLPWTSVGFEAAQAACAAAGRRLCNAAEWLAACEGGMARTYPYGSAYAPMTCNGADRDAVPGGGVDHALAATGALAMCRSADGIADLSGNVKEWTNDRRGTGDPPASLPIYVVRGGSYESPERGLTCATDLARATSDTALPTLGFRCCSNTAP